MRDVTEEWRADKAERRAVKAVAEIARLQAEIASKEALVAEFLEALRAEDAARLAANDYPPGDSLGMDRAMRARTHADTLRRAAIAKATGGQP